MSGFSTLKVKKDGARATVFDALELFAIAWLEIAGESGGSAALRASMKWSSELWVRQIREKVKTREKLNWAKSYLKPRFIVIMEKRSARRLGSRSRAKSAG